MTSECSGAEHTLNPDHSQTDTGATPSAGGLREEHFRHSLGVHALSVLPGCVIPDLKRTTMQCRITVPPDYRPCHPKNPNPLGQDSNHWLYPYPGIPRTTALLCKHIFLSASRDPVSLVMTRPHFEKKRSPQPLPADSLKSSSTPGHMIS